MTSANWHNFVNLPNFPNIRNTRQHAFLKLFENILISYNTSLNKLELALLNS